MVSILLGIHSGKAGAGKMLLTLDACMSQDPHYKNQVTAYPVEVGMDITDHIRIEPDSVKIEGQITNAPDTEVSTTTGNRVVNAYETLLYISGRTILQSRTQKIDEFPGTPLIDLIIKNRVMVDMVCEDLNVPADPATGDVINFTMTFKKIRKATTDIANVSYSTGNKDTLAPQVQKGKQQTVAGYKLNEDGTLTTAAMFSKWGGYAN